MAHKYHVDEVKSMKENVSSLRKECESLPGRLSELKEQRPETVKYRDETMSALLKNCQLKITNKKLDYEKKKEINTIGCCRMKYNICTFPVEI